MMTRKGSCVAIWLGQATDELEVDEYLGNDFGSDFHCCPEENNVPEFTVLPEPLKVHELLKPFSSSMHFMDAASNLAQQKGIIAATTAVIYYHTFFTSGTSPAHTAKLIFLGNFEW